MLFVEIKTYYTLDDIFDLFDVKGNKVIALDSIICPYILAGRPVYNCVGFIYMHGDIEVFVY